MAKTRQEAIQALTEENQRLRAESEALKQKKAGLEKDIEELLQQVRHLEEGREAQDQARL